MPTERLEESGGACGRERERERMHAGEEERESVFHISKLLTVNLLKVLITHIPIFYMVTC